LRWLATLKLEQLKLDFSKSCARKQELVMRRWFSKGKVLSRFYELRNEFLEIVATEKPEFAALIKDETWCSKVA
jgi:hypothetical protein